MQTNTYTPQTETICTELEVYWLTSFHYKEKKKRKEKISQRVYLKQCPHMVKWLKLTFKVYKLQD